MKIADHQPSHCSFVIDTDMGSDDWLAILFLLKYAASTVRLATVTGTGIASIGPGVKNLLKLARVAKRNFPIAAGVSFPMAGSNSFPNEWRTRADCFLGISLPEGDLRPLEQSAVDALVDASRSD